MEPITPQPGSAQAPQTFVGRVEITTRALGRLAQGQNLLVTDPRRMGKTQWLNHLARTTTDFTPVLINYEAVHSSDGLFHATADAFVKTASLPAQFIEALKQLFSKIDQVSIAGATLRPGEISAAQRLGNTIDALSDLATDRKPVLLLIDELPIAIRNITRSESPDAARVVLQTLRALRASAPNVRWILCGSIGLHHVIAQCGATRGDINDLESVPLGPLGEPESLELAARLLLGAGCTQPSSSAISTLSDVCGGIPFLMHKIAQTVSERGNPAPSSSDLDSLFRDFLDDRDGSAAVSHFIERFDVNYGASQTEAMSLLDRVAIAGSLSTVALLDDSTTRDIRGQIVDLLIDDHYLVEERGVLRWRYEVLERIWRHRRRLS